MEVVRRFFLAARRRLKRAAENDSGQMTVELAVVFPVALAIAFVAVNAMGFASECAQFDRLARNAVRVHAAAPVGGQDFDQVAAAVESEVERSFPEEFSDVSVSHSLNNAGQRVFVVTLEILPSLFGLPAKDEVFGVPIPALRHEVSFAVDPYRSGLLEG